jgi:hypothetical protein
MMNERSTVILANKLLVMEMSFVNFINDVLILLRKCACTISNHQILDLSKLLNSNYFLINNPKS